MSNTLSTLSASLGPLVSVAELKDWMSDSVLNDALVILDASWHLPTAGRNPRDEFEHEHLPGARFFDIDQVSDADSALPHMLPSAAVFAEAAQSLGVSNRTQVVVYDSVGLFSAARVWWMFRVFGHASVAVLDGGLPAWRRHSGALESGQPAAAASSEPFHAQLDSSRVCDAQQLLSSSAQPDVRVLDARSHERFLGGAVEPRPGLRSGHIPGSRSLPFTELLDADGLMKTPAELAEVLRKHGVGTASRVTTTCGSGVTAAIITLAMDICGWGLQTLYDGSWSEWGAASELPIATGSD